MGGYKIVKYLFLFIFLSKFFNFGAVGQVEEDISGVINKYVQVTEIGNPDDSTVTVTDVSDFAVDDTVMIIQMKGADAEYWSFGDIDDAHSAGKYEFLIISRINTGSKQVTFSADLLNIYSPAGLVQLVKVPGYRNANVTANLSCNPWDGTVGGVLTFIVCDTLKLNASIDVSGKGFLGAQPVSGSGYCTSVDSAYFSNFFLPATSDSVGRKGESIALYDALHSRGMGRWINGGGGGNGRFAGGGGGSNYGAGGVGGWESASCNSPSYTGDGIKGRGGSFLKFVDGDSTIFFGGGGGSGTQTITDIASNGANGGGIIIVLANVIIGNSHTIMANGSSVITAMAASGGGGGAGGTVLLEINNFSGNLTVEAKGGNGGNTNNNDYFTGPGGGGGGGIIRLSKSSKPANVTVNVSLGAAGKSLIKDPSTGKGGTDGKAGNTEYNLRVPLTGFVFNSILQDQTICEDTAPDTLIGSIPKGAKDSTYLWQYSEDLLSWASASGINDEQHYYAGILTDTTYFRRIIESTNFNLERFQDTSNVVKITVQPLISNNTIQDIDTICSGSAPLALTGSTPGGGDGISYAYTWKSSTDQSAWSIIADSTRQHFAPGQLTDTTYYHRVVSSGACRDTSNQVEITVLPLIVSNSISEQQTICEGSEFNTLIGTLPQKGNGSYTYEWESSEDNSNWQDTIITNTNQNYQPLAASLYYPGQVYYKRIVRSGHNDCCKDTSNILKLEVLPEIKNNTILDDQTVCYGTAPALFTTGTLPIADGAGIYSFIWQKSLNDITWGAAGGVGEDYLSGALTQNTYFRRIVNSGACTDTSSSIYIDLYPLPVANISPLRDTVCSGSPVGLTFNISGINPTWELVYTNSKTNTTLSGVSSPLNISAIPVTNNEKEVFYYSVVSVTDSKGCKATDISGKDTVIVFGIPDANAGVTDSVCGLIYTLHPVPSVGDGLWTTTGDANFDNPSQSNTEVTALNYGTVIFTWTETNWNCPSSFDNVSISFFEEPSPPYAGEDTLIFFNDTITLRASALTVGVGEWTLVDGGGDIISASDSITKITDLPQGNNLFRWTVTNGNCPEHFDEVLVSVHDIEVPTGFSPNNDGKNDCLTINGLQDNPKVETCKFIVYNRWGKIIFKTTDKDFVWDGTYNNNSGEGLPEGTYYYVLEVNDSHSYKGFLLIKRK